MTDHIWSGQSLSEKKWFEPAKLRMMLFVWEGHIEMESYCVLVLCVGIIQNWHFGHFNSTGLWKTFKRIKEEIEEPRRRQWDDEAWVAIQVSYRINLKLNKNYATWHPMSCQYLIWCKIILKFTLENKLLSYRSLSNFGVPCGQWTNRPVSRMSKHNHLLHAIRPRSGNHIVVNSP